MIQAVYIISEGDLLSISDFSVSLKSGTPEEKLRLKTMLYHLGMDVSLPCELQEVTTHRLWDKSIYTGNRYVGLERTDKEWLSSGYASLEAKLAAKGDWSMVEELNNMRKGQPTMEGCDTLFEIGEE